MAVIRLVCPYRCIVSLKIDTPVSYTHLYDIQNRHIEEQHDQPQIAFADPFLQLIHIFSPQSGGQISASESWNR